MFSGRKILGVYLVVLLATALPVLGQVAATGQVNGTVTDPSGAVIPDASVTLTNKGTNISRRTSTNPSGNFVFVNVAPAAYALRVEAKGFKAAETPPFDVGVNQAVTEPLTLAVGEVSQTVEVSATAAMLEPTTTKVGTVITEKAVHDLPLNGRNISELLTLEPGVTPISTAQGSGVSSQDAGMTGIPGTQLLKPSFHGQQNRFTVYFQDGFINSDLRGNVYGYLPNVDAVQEFQAISHDTDTEFGGVAGGVVNIISKSGTNQYHGDLFEFDRNNVFDARNPFKDVGPGPNKTQVVRSVAPFRQNQFGATVGGPIPFVRLPLIKNKTFFFFGWESWRFSQPNQNLSQVPTAAELQGDFSQSVNINPIFNPFSTRPNPKKAGTFIRDPFTCNASGNPTTPNPDGTQTGGTPCQKIPSQLVNPAVEKFLQAYSETPNFVGNTSQNFINNLPTTDDNDRFELKVDQHFSERDSVFFRYARMKENNETPTGLKQFKPSLSHATNVGEGWTHIFSPTLLLDVRVGWLSKPFTFADERSTLGTAPATAAGFKGIDQFGGLLLSLGGPFGGPASTIGTEGDLERNNPSWSGTVNLNKIKGNHNFKFGGSFIHTARLQINQLQTVGFGSDVTNNPLSAGNTGNGLASALLGFPDTFGGQIPNLSVVHLNMGVWGFYFHDQWKVSPKLSVNYGMRYDFALQPRVVGNRLSNGIDFQNKVLILGASAFPTACNPPQFINPCVPGGIQSVPFNDHIVLAGKKNFIDKPTYDNFSPRFGVAWQVTPNTAVRGGYALLFNTLSALTQSSQNDLEALGWPFTTGFGNAASGTVVNNVLSTQPGSLTSINSIVGAFPTPLPPPTPWTASGWADDPQLKNPLSHQWNFEIQRQMGQSLLISAAYVGAHNRRLPYTGFANAVPFASPNGTPAAQIDPLRAFPFIRGGNIRYTRSLGTSDYNAFELSVRRRFSGGLTSQLSYTWSHCLDESSGFFNVENGAGGPGVQNFFDRDSNRGTCGFDVKHFMSWFTVYELPAGRGKRWLQSGPASWFLGNWQLNWIMQARSGQAYTLGVNAGDIANLGGSLGTITGYGRPNQVGNPFANVPAGLAFNPAAFAIPSGSFGNVGKDTLRSDNVFNVDVSLFKSFPLGNSETRRLELRVESFNAFNIQNSGIPNTTIGNANAGLVTSLAGNTFPREFQFGGKIIF